MGIVFDAHGVPEGDSGAAMFDLLFEQLNTADDAAGWDRPSALMGVTSPAATVALLAESGLSVDDFSLGEEFWSTGFLIVPVATFTGHPLAELVGLDLPDDFSAAVLRTEGWAYPREPTDTDLAAPPMASPDRREVRAYLAVTRDGSSASRVFVRTSGGSRPADADDQAAVLDGRVVSAVGRCIGAHVTASAHPPLPLTSYLGCLLALTVAAEYQGSGEVLQAVRAVVASTGPHPGGVEPTAALMLTMVAAARIASTVVGAGFEAAPQRFRQALVDLASGRPAGVLLGEGPDSLVTQGLIAQMRVMTADRSWTAAIADDALAHAGTQWPAGLPDDIGAAFWLGEDTLASWAAAGAPFTLAQVHAAVDLLDEDCAPVVGGAISMLGWGFPGGRPPGRLGRDGRPAG